MPKLPSANDLGRAVPTARSNTLSYSTEGAERIVQSSADRAAITSKFSADLGDIQEKRAEDKRRLDILKAESYVLQATTELNDKIAQNPDWTQNEQLYNQQFTEIQNQAQSLIPPEKREEFSYALQNIRTKGMSSVRDITRSKEDNHYRAEEEFSFERNAQVMSMAYNSGNLEAGNAALENQLRVIQENQRAGRWDEDVAARRILDTKNRMIESTIDSMEPAAAHRLLEPTGSGPRQADASQIIPQVIEHSEGGFVAVDGASGAPALYGINRKYHEAAHDEAMRITKEQGEVAGKKYAQGFYKREYWDAHGLDKYSAPVARVLFDGVINHGTGFRKKLLSAADNGAGPDELISMRQEEYNRLAQDPAYAPSLRGWENRLTNLSKTVSAEQSPASGIASLLPPDSLARIRDRVGAKMQQIETKAAVDSIKFASVEQERQLLAQYSDRPAVVSAYEQKRKALREDPAGYALNHPDVLIARQRAQDMVQAEGVSEDQKQLANNAYYELLKEKQVEMGLMTYQARVVPNEEAAAVIDTLVNPGSETDDILQSIDAFVGSYGDAGRLALNENGIEGAAYALTIMKPGQDRFLLAQALKDGQKTLEGAVDDSSLKKIRQAAAEAVGDYASANAHTKFGAKNTESVRSAIETMALKYTAMGMSASDAAKEAKRRIIDENYRYVGGVQYPAMVEKDVAQEFNDSRNTILSGYDVYLPQNIKDRPGSQAYKEAIYRDATIKNVSDTLYFYGPDGGVLYDSALVRLDENGRVSNPEEAAIRVPLRDGIAQTKSFAYRQMKGYRNNLMQKSGRDIKKDFTPYSRAFAGGPQMPALHIQDPNKNVSVYILDKKAYSQLPDTQKKVARDRIRSMVSYTKAYRELLPDDARAEFDEIYKLNKEGLSRPGNTDFKQLGTVISPAMMLEEPEWLK